jgi:hypothetical protein
LHRNHRQGVPAPWLQQALIDEFGVTGSSSRADSNQPRNRATMIGDLERLAALDSIK